MLLQPDSTVNLYSGVDIDMGSGVQIAFSSIANQRAYFNSKVVRTNYPCTPIKKSGRIKLDAPGSLIKNCNYLSFVNPSFDNKTVYARIIDYDYVNPDTVEVTYLIDFWQTWMFDVDFERCGIVRQYLNETDYEKAIDNPYDPDIYAFQTTESLPVDKTMEKIYNYDCTSDGSSDSQDGDYLFMAHRVPNSGIAKYLQGSQGTIETSSDTGFTNIFNVYFIAPFDVWGISQQAGQNWDSLLNQIRGAHGWTCLPNTRECESMSSSNNAIHGFLFSNFSKPYYILAIPSIRKDLQDTMLDYLTEWSVVNNILSVYAIPVPMFLNAMDGIGDVDLSEEDMLDYDDVAAIDYEYKTAYANRNNQSYVPHCQKLFTSPYSYFRVENPSGDIKEYRYEDFLDIRNGSENTVKFRTILDLNCNPSLVTMPYKYKLYNNIDASISGGTNYHPAISANFNVLERMEYKDFPQVPYVIDGYLMHLATEVNRAIGSYTTNTALSTASEYLTAKVASQASEFRKSGDYWNLASDVAGDASELSGAALSKNYGAMASKIPGMIGRDDYRTASHMTNTASIYTSGAAAEMAQNNINLATASGRDFLGGNKGAVNFMFGMTRPAYAQDIYQAGTQGGLYNHISGSSIIDLRITRVWLKDSVLRVFDEYFKTYGYNVTGQVDVPYVIKYTQGASSDDDVPHWEQVNGKDSTYIQTQDCHITHSMLPVSTALEAMFNSGVRMLKGESLYS